MDFKDSIRLLVERSKRKQELLTEEATKHALVLPFISALGYDIFNPSEVVPEMDCDIAKKKGEKIDYAILSDGEPIMLIECKHWQEDLNEHEGQLKRYFASSNARFGLLTNGIEYRFYCDLDKENVMDDAPFFVFDIEHMKDEHIENLKQFSKPYFDTDAIVDSAAGLKYKRKVLAVIGDLIENPTPDFVRLVGKQVYDGSMTQKVLDQFTPIIKSCFATYVNDIISERLQTAVKTQEEEVARVKQALAESETVNCELIPTEEEIQAYGTIKAVLSDMVDTSRIGYVITSSYFAIVLDGTARKTIARLNIRGKKKSVQVNHGTEWPRHQIGENVTDSIIKLKSEFAFGVNFYNKETTEQANG